MGMDYQFSGSASYPRFENELCMVADIFGAERGQKSLNKQHSSKANFSSYMFGFLNADNSEEDFIFPVDTDPIIVKWFNHIYDKFTPEETKKIFEYVSKHPEIKKISHQIWHELEVLCECDLGWYIY